MTYLLKKFRLPLVLAVSFLDYLSFAFIIPHTYSLILAGPYSLVANSISNPMRYIILGGLLATYPLAQILGNPILGAISDALSRKRVLLISFVGNFLGYALSAYAIYSHQILYLFLGNGLAGLTGANISTMNAIIADLSTLRKKARRFSLSIMTFGLAFIIGPFISGQLIKPLSNFGQPVLFIFLLSAVLSLLNFMLISFFFHDTMRGMRIPKLHLRFIGQDIRNLFNETKELKAIFFSVFALYFGWYFFIKFFRVLLLDRLHYTIEAYCNILSYFGICCLIAQGIYTFFSTRIQEERVLKIAAPLLAFSIFSLAAIKAPFTILCAVTLFSFSYAIICPALTFVVSEFGGSNHQGKVMGLFQSVQAIAQVLAPSLAGLAMAAHPIAPILVSGVFVFSGGFLFNRAMKPAST
ncbi:MAG TPA: MFS transporter [Chlamydiales bacterium]|nr:MFS transporter [Chlamydiales bacterium]HPE85142.1 MFS transporter [Chlamydiales bacterium]